MNEDPVYSVYSEERKANEALHWLSPIGVKLGEKYYDHNLTQIEKGKLIDPINGQSVEKDFTTAGDAPSRPNALSIYKDTKLISILKVNSSKAVDENGEPLVVYHGTLGKGLHKFNKDSIVSKYSYDEKEGFFISNKKADNYATLELDSNQKALVCRF